jgi:hypothetical protein
VQSVRTQSPALALGRQFIAASGQSLLSVAVFCVAVLAAAAVWMAFPPTVDHPWGVAVLAGSVPLAAYVSLPVRRGVRLYFTGASILFIVALLSPSLAIAVMGVGMLAKELSICRRCGNTAWQVLGQVGRWMLIALCASFLVHLLYVPAGAVLIAGFLWIADVLTAPLVFLRRSPLPALYRTLIARTWSEELMQYMTGALLVPVLLAERQDAMFVAASVSIMALWLLMWYVLQNSTERQME